MSTILLPYDGSDPAKQAVEFAADSFPDAEVTLLHVVRRPAETGYDLVGMPSKVGESTAELLEAAHERGEELLDEAATIAADADLEVHREVVEGNPQRKIVEYAEENDVDHVVIGSHGRTGASRVFLGSVAERVARRSPTPVTIVR